MKIVRVLLVLLLLVGCGPEDAVPNEPSIDEFDTSNGTIVSIGSFVGVGHTASGTATIFDKKGVKTVVLDPYNSQNGPDLKVYLSKTDDGSEYINLGKLKSTMGKQSYAIPSTVNVNDYPYTLIWCEQFSVLFARAEMK